VTIAGYTTPCGTRIGAIAPSVLAVMTVPRAASAITRIVADHWQHAGQRLAFPTIGRGPAWSLAHAAGRYGDARLY